MQFRDKLKSSPEFARFAPFFIFVLLTAGQGWLGEDAKFWMYALKTLVGAWLIWEMRPFVSEMRWAFSWEAVAVGVGVCVMWVGLNPYYPMNHLFFKPTPGDEWNPFAAYGGCSSLAWFYVIVRTLGSAIVVPPLEEVFYRSLVYRYFIKYDFLKVPLGRFHVTSFIVTSTLFGLMHYQWLAGILCGMAYQGLVIRKGRLGDAMLAHGITNFLLGVWIIWKGDWQFW